MSRYAGKLGNVSGFLPLTRRTSESLGPREHKDKSRKHFMALVARDQLVPRSTFKSYKEELEDGKGGDNIEAKL